MRISLPLFHGREVVQEYQNRISEMLDEASGVREKYILYVAERENKMWRKVGKRHPDSRIL